MRAVVLAGPGKVRVDDVAEPAIVDPADAIVRITKSAICASDLHVIHGKTPGMPEGAVIGHEYVGIVTDVGSNVTKHRVEDRVLGSFLIACGRCGPCSSGSFNFCRNRRALGFGPVTGDLPGAQAEFVRVPDADVNLLGLNGHLAALHDEQALFAGDILATGFYAASLADIDPGDTVVVVGAGPVGAFCAAAARRHTDRVIVLDTDPARVAFATEKMGLDAIDVSSDDPQGVVAVRTGSEMAAVAMDAVGSVPAFKTAMRCVAEGGRVAVIGVYGPERYELPMGMSWIRGIDIRFAGMCNVQAHWQEALESTVVGDLDPTAIITHRLPLDDAPEGYELFESRAAMKVVLTP